MTQFRGSIDDTASLYRSMDDKELMALKRAFENDRSHATRLSTVGFCETRIKLIETIMGERAESLSEPSAPDKEPPRG